MAKARTLLGVDPAPLSATELARLRRQEQLYVLDSARTLAKGNEELRRALLGDMKALGAGRKGSAPLTRAECALLEANFDIARSRLAAEGKRPSDYAAARYLADRTKLYPQVDPQTLLRRYRRRKATR